jgi:sulfatase modifying factor 1
MKKPLTLLLTLLSTTLLLAGSAHAQRMPANLVLVKGGTFKNSKSNYYGKKVTLSSFYIGKYDVTQREWVDVMGSNPSQFKGDYLPVEMVNWYDCVEYCNQRSAKEGLSPYYNIDKLNKDPNNERDPQFDGDLDTVKWTVTINAGANGYRLPTEAEWEYAADGGQLSKSYTYSGSNDIEKVAWYWKNSGT